MAFCSKCGTELTPNMAACPNCGQPQYAQGQPVYQQPAQPPVVDNGGFLWGLLGCCIPIVGLILFLVWKDTKPKTAKAAGIGALVSVILCVLYYLLVIALGVGVAFSGI